MTSAGSQSVPSPEQRGSLTRPVLTPADAHAVFRAVLDALARPGTLHRLPEGSGQPPALLPVLALATLDTPVALLGDSPDGRWREQIRLITSAPHAGAGAARLLAALRPLVPAEIVGLARGSAEAPEDGALASVAVASVDGGEQAYELRGPGVDGVITIAPRGWDGPLHAARAEATTAFPAGPDLLLVAPDGRFFGLPRSTHATPAPAHPQTPTRGGKR